LAHSVQQSSATPATHDSGLAPDPWELSDRDVVRLSSDSSYLPDPLQTFTDAEDNLPHGDDAGCLDFSIGVPSVGQDMGWYRQEAYELRFGGDFDGYCKLELVPQGCKLILPAEDLWLRRKHGFYEDSILLLSANCCLRGSVQFRFLLLWPERGVMEI
jgi:hypothetical protein